MNHGTRTRRHLLLVMGGRSELAFSDLHAEPLYAHALRALAALGEPVTIGVDAPDLDRVRDDAERWGLAATALVQDDWWSTVRDAPGGGLLAQDVLCPLVTPAFVAEVSRRADERPGTALVAVRPVTDTLKVVVDGKIEGTIDRDGLAAVTSPMAVPAGFLVDADDDPPPVGDFAAMVSWLRARGDVELMRAPSLGRRVEHARAVHLLECVDEVGHRVRASVPEDRP